MQRLLEIMARLRDPVAGCPWDIQQNFRSIAPYTIEEAYEVADAIDRADMGALRDELGDLLLQVVYHARMAEEAGAFAFSDVVQAICEKMVRRHPHVFGDERVADAEAQTRAWSRLKAEERRAGGDRGSVLDDITRGLPATSRAHKLGRRAASVGFDWPDASAVVEKMREELRELEADLDDPRRLEEEVGDLLFTIVNLCRHRRLDADRALREANAKFERRFRAMETRCEAAGHGIAELGPDDLERLWQAVKQEGA
jgi:ATP diphosphatase